MVCHVKHEILQIATPSGLCVSGNRVVTITLKAQKGYLGLGVNSAEFGD